MGGSKREQERRRQKKSRQGRRREPSGARESNRAAVTRAARWPVSGAFVNQDWRASAGAGVILFRRHPYDGRVAAAMFFVDLGCLGVKRTFLQEDVDVGQLLEQMSGGSALVEIPPDLAAAIVTAGAAFGERLGFPQHPDLPLMREMLRGLDPERGGPIETGRNGRPLYVAGPDDDVEAVLHHLEQRLGPDGFRFFVPVGEEGEEEEEAPSAIDLPPAPGLIRAAAHDDARLDDALLRCGTMKQALVAWAVQQGIRGRETDRPWGEMMSLDLAILLGESSPGRTVIEAFLDVATGLDDTERALVRSWSLPAIGAFRVLARNADHLVLDNLVDDLQYVARSNFGASALGAVFAEVFLLAVLVPGPRDWLLSGEVIVLDENAAFSAARNIGRTLPRQTQRNRALVERAHQLQRDEHEQFVARFGDDEVVCRGDELQALVDGWHRDRQNQIRAAAAAEGRVLPEGEMPPMDLGELTGFESVGLLSDPVGGLGFLPYYGAFRHAFEHPEEASLELVEDYLVSDSIEPMAFERMVARFPAGVDRVLSALTGDPDFRWDRDGTALMRRHKPWWFAKPPLPTTFVVPERLATWIREHPDQ